MDPLDGMDAAFLALDSQTSMLHVAAVLVLDPPEGRRSLFSPSTRYAQIRHLIESRIDRVAPMRQRVVKVPLGLHHPVWIDDPDFDLDDHLSRASLPQPGGSRELDELVADFVARPLDPERPLWEMAIVEGLSEGRMAVVAKMHHAIVDGVSGASLLAAFFDLGPRERTLNSEIRRPTWDPDPVPTRSDLLRYALSSMSRQPGVIVDAVNRGAEVIADVGARNRVLAESGESPPPAPFSAPRTSINGNLSVRRRYATFSAPLEDIKLVRRAYGCTVNDVILASVAGGLRRLLSIRRERPDGALVALVPVSSRPAGGDKSTEPDSEELGNKITGMLVSLATDIDDPIDRLLAISRSSQVAKAQELLTGSQLFHDVTQIAPPALARGLMKMARGFGVFARLPPLFNATISSVPGPDFSLWCAGSRVVAMYPVGPITEGSGLNVTTMTYMSVVHFGMLGCRRLMPEIQDLAILVDDALGELVNSALRFEDLVG